MDVDTQSAKRTVFKVKKTRRKAGFLCTIEVNEVGSIHNHYYFYNSHMKTFKFTDADIHKMPQGTVHIVHSDEKFSLGYLHIDPKQKLDKIAEPVDQEIIQLKGMSNIFVFHQGDEPEEVVLHAGDYLMIPAHTYYIQTNPNEEPSLSSWKLDGNVVHVMKELRMLYPKV